MTDFDFVKDMDMSKYKRKDAPKEKKTRKKREVITPEMKTSIPDYVPEKNMPLRLMMIRVASISEHRAREIANKEGGYYYGVCSRNGVSYHDIYVSKHSIFRA